MCSRDEMDVGILPEYITTLWTSICGEITLLHSDAVLVTSFRSLT